MLNYFNECKTVSELNLKRSELLTEINKEYSEKRKVLLNSETGIRPLRTISLETITVNEVPISSAFKIKKGEVQENRIALRGEILYI